MGQATERTDFTEEDFVRFRDRLGSNLKSLEKLLQTPGFGDGPMSFGAELELYIVNEQGRPLPINKEIQQALGDDQLTLELNRFNLEYNFSPVLVRDSCFGKTEAQALTALSRINTCAGHWQGSVFPIGILPTLTPDDLGLPVMTDEPRYHALTDELRRIRGGPFSVNIHGEDRIDMEMEDVTLEGANTSFQVHLKVRPAEFADLYNAIQLVTPLVMAISANSPLLFGKRLWHETRVPLFKQSIDCRRPDPLHPRPARVNYGNAWVRHGAYELFAEAVRLYRPILPVCGEEDPFVVMSAGQAPQLSELRLQMGTVWLWNRPVYDPADGGHLRIEMRTLPAGPSIKDMMANAALMIGLARLLQASMGELIPSIPFEYCVRNFYRAAEKGLAAKIIWPSTGQSEPEYHSAASILARLLPMLPRQLSEMGFVESDFTPLLEIIRERLESRQTGAQWQLDRLAALQKTMSLEEALLAMQQDYQRNSLQNVPVAQWSLS
ncbi:MAG: glutamate-cysteine ligase family protein [Pseudohongiella sp.]